MICAEVLASSVICDEKHRKNAVINYQPPHPTTPLHKNKIGTNLNQSIYCHKSLVTIVDSTPLKRKQVWDFLTDVVEQGIRPC